MRCLGLNPHVRSVVIRIHLTGEWPSEVDVDSETYNPIVTLAERCTGMSIKEHVARIIGATVENPRSRLKKIAIIADHSVLSGGERTVVFGRYVQGTYKWHDHHNLEVEITCSNTSHESIDIYKNDPLFWLLPETAQY